MFSCHNFEISRNSVNHLENVYSNKCKTETESSSDDMFDSDVNAMIWGILTSATMRAAVYLGQDYQDNLRTTKNTDFEKVKKIRYFGELILRKRMKIHAESKGTCLL